METYSNTAYDKMKGFANTHGQMFEVKLAALLFLRCKNSDKIVHFQLACNVAGAGAMDDLVLRFTTVDRPIDWNTCFVQLKHKERAKINEAALEGVGDFSLKKYFDAFVTIKNGMSLENKTFLFSGSPENCHVVLYTNAVPDRALVESSRSDVTGDVVDLLQSGMNGQMILKLGEDWIERLSTVCKSLDQKLSKVGESSSKIDEKCEVDKKISSITEFIKRLKIFCAQRQESELDELIVRELLIATGRAANDADLLYRIYEERVKRWWGDVAKSDVLHENCDLLNEVSKAFDIEASLIQQVEKLVFKIKFNNELWTQFNFVAMKEHPATHVVCTGASVRMTCTKVYELLRSNKAMFLMLGLQSLVQESNTIISHWAAGTREILVIVSDSTEEHPLVCNQLSDVLREDRVKSIIVVSCTDDPFATRLRSSLNDKCNEILDSFLPSHLHSDTLNQILTKNILFQSHPVKLGELFANSIELSELVLTDSLVESVLTKNNISFGPELKNVLEFYIPRTLKRHNILKKDILQSVTLHTVLSVSGDRQSNLSAGECGCLASNEITVEEDFRKLCTNHKSVHWLQLTDGELAWVATQGDIRELKNFVNEELHCTYPATPVVLSTIKNNRVILLVAEPGMGKSTLVSYIARESKICNPHDWVVRVDLKDHMNLLDDGCDDVIQFLMTATGMDSCLARALFWLSCNYIGNVIVLLDGFDEIVPVFQDQGLALLSGLLQTSVKQIWVTSRKTTNLLLENFLSTIAFNLHPFSDEDQVNFFKSFWKQKATPVSLFETEIGNFVRYMQHMVTISLNDAERKFTGIPLQSMMLAEYFEDYVLDPINNKCPEDLGILELFENVIEKKFILYTEKISLSKNTIPVMITLRKKFHKDHMCAALVLLLGEQSLQALESKGNIINAYKRFVLDIEDSNEKTGIVDSIVNGKPNFLHRTFAEYFVASWFRENYTANRDFLKFHLFEANFFVVRSFLDRLLARSSELHTAVVNDDVAKVVSSLEGGSSADSEDDGGRTALHLISVTDLSRYRLYRSREYVSAQTQRVFEIVPRYCTQVDKNDSVLGWSPLKYALEQHNWLAAATLLKFDATVTPDMLLSKEVIVEKQLCIFALKYGHVQFMEFLLDCGVDVNLYVKRRMDFYPKTLLQLASIFGYTDLTKLLLNRGGDIWLLSGRDGSTALHFACEGGHSHVVRMLIEHLGDDHESVTKYIDTRDSIGALPFILASTPEVVDYLLSVGADLWATHTASKNTALHNACTKGHTAVATTLIASLGNDREAIGRYVNEKNARGKTSLHLSTRITITRCLLSNGADVWALDDGGGNPLHDATAIEHLLNMRELLDHVGPDPGAVARYVNVRDYEGSSLLHKAMLEGGVQMLVEAGADPWLRDHRGFTPLHSAVKRGRLRTVKALVANFPGDPESLREYILATDLRGRTASDYNDEAEAYYFVDYKDSAAWLGTVLQDIDAKLAT